MFICQVSDELDLGCTPLDEIDTAVPADDDRLSVTLINSTNSSSLTPGGNNDFSSGVTSTTSPRSSSQEQSTNSEQSLIDLGGSGNSNMNSSQSATTAAMFDPLLSGAKTTMELSLNSSEGMTKSTDSLKKQTGMSQEKLTDLKLCLS